MAKKVEWVITFDPSEPDGRGYSLVSEVDGAAGLPLFFATEAAAKAAFETLKENVRRRREGAPKKEILREVLDA